MWIIYVKSCKVPEIYDITGVENPNNVMQMKAWLSENGVEAKPMVCSSSTEPIVPEDGQIAGPDAGHPAPCRRLRDKFL